MRLRTKDSSTFKYPEMRDELLETIRTLSDAEYQRKVWVKHEFPPGVQYDEFDLAVHFLYDQPGLAENPEDAIGLFVKDEYEVQLIKAVIQALEQVFEVLGMNSTDEEYISSPEWAGVLKAASKAWQVMKDNVNSNKGPNLFD